DCVGEPASERLDERDVDRLPAVVRPKQVAGPQVGACEIALPDRVLEQEQDLTGVECRSPRQLAVHHPTSASSSSGAGMFKTSTRSCSCSSSCSSSIWEERPPPRERAGASRFL